MNTICYVAGHSGGHIIPCLTLAAVQRQAGNRVLFIATDTALDRTVIGNNSTVDQLVFLNIEQVPYRKPWRLPLFLFTFVRALVTSWRMLKREQVAQVITTGGYVAIPVCLAARMLKIPITLFELNVVPGKTVKFLAPLARTIAVVFPQTQRYFSNKTCTVEPYPIRFKVFMDSIQFSPSENHSPRTDDLQHMSYGRTKLIQELAFTSERKTIFILGGSQGSAALNRMVADWAKAHAIYPAQIIHQLGRQELVAEYEQLYRSLALPAHVFGFSDNLAPYYQLADLVITRAGAGTLAELQHFKTRAIIVPLETKLTDHQLYNALAVQELEPTLFTVLRQGEIKQNSVLLAQAIAPIFQTSAPRSENVSAALQDQQ